MAKKDVMMITNEEMYYICSKCIKDIGALAMVHTENGHLIHEVLKRYMDENFFVMDF